MGAVEAVARTDGQDGAVICSTAVGYSLHPRNCLVNGKTLLKRCILAMAWPQNGAKAAVSETCKVLFGAYRGLQNSF